MNELTRRAVIGCISFTFSCLFYLLFSFLNIFPPLNEEMLINIFLISFGITCSIALLHLISIRNLMLLRFLEFMIVMAILFLAGTLLKMFPLNLYYSGFVIITGLLTYACVIIIIFIDNLDSARQINASIRSKERGAKV